MIDEATKQRILEAAKIEEVVGDFVTLRRKGANLWGLCPFHDDKSPSFSVNPARNYCKCFACGKGGSPVTFIMEHEHMTFPEALRYLAKKYNIEIVEKAVTQEELQARTNRDSMLSLNDYACKYFTQQLWETEEGQSVGLSYFRERGFTDEIIHKFNLGYSLDKYSAFSEQAVRSGFSSQHLLNTGLATESSRQQLIDRFRGRVIFPVHTLSGRVVAFGGRVLVKTEKTAKYVNSPESEIYHKSNELYGIYYARDAIIKKDSVFLVEGYTDVISMHQSGVENVVASSGTALTHGQIRMIHRFTSNIVVLYDGDAAGIKASLRGIDLLLEEGMNVKVVLLPDGEDPDSFAQSHNANDFITYMDEHKTDFIQFKIDLLLEDAGQDPIKKAQLISDIVRSIAVIPDDIIRSVYVQNCASQFDMREMVLNTAVNKERNRHRAELAKRSTAGTEEASAAGTDAASQGTATGPQPLIPDLVNSLPVTKRSDKPFTYNQERKIMRYVVKYGKQELHFQNVNHMTFAIPLAQYVHEILALDHMPLQYPMHLQILQEALETPLTDIRSYFLNHPDLEVQKYVFSLVEGKYENYVDEYYKTDATGEAYQEKLRHHLEEVMPQLVLEFKKRTVEGRLKDLLGQIKIAAQQKNQEVLAQLAQEQMETKQLQVAIEKSLRESKIIRHN